MSLSELKMTEQKRKSALAPLEGRIGALKALCALTGSLGAVIPGYAYFSQFAPPNFREITLLTGGLALVVLVATLMRRKGRPSVTKATVRIFAAFFCLVFYGVMLDLTTVTAPADFQTEERFQIGFGMADWSLTDTAKDLVKTRGLDTKEQIMLAVQGYTDTDAVKLAWHWWSVRLAQAILLMLFTVGFLLWTHGFALLAMVAK